MEPVTLFSFALIVGYIILTIVFSFTMSFHAGLIMGAFGYIFYEAVKIFLPFLKMGMSFIKFLKLMFVLWIIYIIFMIIMSIIRSGKKDKKELK
jgi:hypothetical protein